MLCVGLLEALPTEDLYKASEAFATVPGLSIMAYDTKKALGEQDRYLQAEREDSDKSIFPICMS
jgi:hypothetical protein